MSVEHLEFSHGDASDTMKVTLFCDGASRGNPGPAAYGFVIFKGERQVVCEGKKLGLLTNNVAEYEGLIRGLAACKGLGATNVVVKSDSELLVRQLNGEYRVKASHLVPLFQKARKLVAEFEKVSVTHVRREYNKLADKLCNDALDGL